jgi:nitrite reductase (NADH) small subunit
VSATDPSAPQSQVVGGVWRDVAALADVTAKKKLVVDIDGTPVLVLWHDDHLYAMANICIHRDREMHKGVILNGKMICPGHQWAFALDTGYESIKQQCQPVYDVRVDNDRVHVFSVARPPVEPCGSV